MVPQLASALVFCLDIAREGEIVYIKEAGHNDIRAKFKDKEIES